MDSGVDKIHEWLNAYKKKYYQNLLVKGIILSFALLLSIFLIFNSIEYTFRLAGILRATLLILFVIALSVVSWRWVFTPISRLFRLKRQLSNEEAAVQIGKYFPQIGDKLLNTIQLQNTSAPEQSLIHASITQRTKELGLFSFPEAVNFRENKKYIKYLVPPVLITSLLLLFIPQLFTEGTVRIINFNKEFVETAPFEFNLENKSLNAFKNEDFSLTLGFTGSYHPNEAYIFLGGRKIKMEKEGDRFLYTFNNIQQDKDFHFEAAGFSSSPYEVKVLSRPNLKGFNINLLFPSYLKKEKERLENSGNLLIPEGTTVQWQFNSVDTDSLTLHFAQENTQYTLPKAGDQLFTFEKKISDEDVYEVKLKNKNSLNKDEIKYTIEVIKDKYPEISLETFSDTTLYNFLVLGGDVSDDYGLRQLKVFYKIETENEGKERKFKSFNIPLTPNQPQQSYYYPWRTDSLDLKAGGRIKYFLQVWDNDGVNGSKSAKTSLYTFEIPTQEEVDKKLKEASNNTKEKISGNQEKAKSIKEDLREIEDRLKGKKQLDWQDKKKIEELLKKKEDLNQALEKLKEQNKANNLQQERFGEKSEKIREKAQELQKLMDELLDDETKKLYEELRKLMEEQKDANTIQEQLSKINTKEKNLENELERTLELFKRMQFDQKLEKAVEKSEDLAKEQESLSEKTEQAEKEDQEELLTEQRKLNEDFKKLQKDLEELKDLNQELKNPNALQNTSEEEQQISEAQKKSEEALQENKKQKASKQQKQAGKEMQELSKKLEEMQSGMEMSMMQENLDHLRDILDNLVKLSFDQESLMDQFREVNQSDPRFVNLSQQQLKLKDDAKVIQDSLLSLANRVFQIQSFVTREVEDMNGYMTGSLDALRERNQGKALSNQQFAMTSMNNLALLLSDVLKQMQQQMADAMGKPQKGKGKQQSMSMGELQKQLNDKISELKKSGKSGRALSEELAKLAAEQEEIRRALQEEMQQAGNEQGKGAGGSGKQIIEKMEETEADLVNKEITEKTIKRQQDILTRLLESENAMREREQDEKREAEQAKSYDQIVPKAFEEYIKAKEKEVELLKTVPPRLNPYYLQEVNEYFKRLKKTNI